MHRGDLTNAEWARLTSLLPPGHALGDRWDEHRMMINGVLYQARTGLRWRHLPGRFGCWVTAYRHHRHWTADGTWRHLLTAIETAEDAPMAGGRPAARIARHPRQEALERDPVLLSLHTHLAAVVSRKGA
ncbi:transposase [Nonomuraea sp. NPDC005650]|uniref:transposase n=1 Tax=Nonomuraea sp. NPDC005650 TaxID=3157045 RepID=UPI0033BF6C63